MKSDSITQLMNAIASPYSTSLAEREAMQERLYSAVLTIGTFKGIAGGTGSSWPAFIRDVADHLEADDIDPRTGRPMRTKDLSVNTRYQPTAKEIDACLPTMELLSGFHTQQAMRAQERVKDAYEELKRLEKRRDDLIKGVIPVAAARKADVVYRVALQITQAERALNAKQEIANGYKGSLRKAVGALKAAARFVWLGSPRGGPTKWERAAAWAGVKNPLEARLYHDEAILWACASDRKLRETS